MMIETKQIIDINFLYLVCGYISLRSRTNAMSTKPILAECKIPGQKHTYMDTGIYGHRHIWTQAYMHPYTWHAFIFTGWKYGMYLIDNETNWCLQILTIF